MHLSRNSWFTSINVCLCLVFIVLQEISPLTTIWRCFIRFWKNSAIQISPSAFRQDCLYPGCSYHSLLPHTWVTMVEWYYYISTERFGFYCHLFHSFRYLCWIFFPRHFYTSLSLQRRSLLWQLSMCCFLLSGVLHIYYAYSTSPFCKVK